MKDFKTTTKKGFSKFYIRKIKHQRTSNLKLVCSTISRYFYTSPPPPPPPPPPLFFPFFFHSSTHFILSLFFPSVSHIISLLWLALTLSVCLYLSIYRCIYLILSVYLSLCLPFFYFPKYAFSACNLLSSPISRC